MSVRDVGTSTSIRGLVPRMVPTPPDGVLVRWLLRLTTVIVFAVATAVGVSVGLTAPTESPVSISGRDR